VIDQMERIVERIAESPITRRAVATTRVPELDCFLLEDCRASARCRSAVPADEDGSLVLNMDTRWRSATCYKAWCDNVVALTFLQQVLAQQIEKRTGIPCRVAVTLTIPHRSTFTAWISTGSGEAPKRESRAYSRNSVPSPSPRLRWKAQG